MAVSHKQVNRVRPFPLMACNEVKRDPTYVKQSIKFMNLKQYVVFTITSHYTATLYSSLLTTKVDVKVDTN